MKVGETVDVTIAGQVVAQAKVVELGAETTTLIVPATQVVMAVSTQLSAAPAPEQSKQVIIDGVDRVDGQGNVIEAEPPVAEEST